jgi:DNA adenine methylase
VTSGISAFACIGGKAGLADKIIPYIPPHITYSEPCCGGMAVLLNKPPSPVEVVNDINGDIVNFWRVLRDQRDAFIAALQATPYARDEYAACDLAWRRQDPATDVERARRWYVLMRQSFGERMGL